MKLVLVIVITMFANSLQAAICGKIVNMRGEIEILRLKSDSPNAVDEGRLGMLAKNKTKLWCSDIIITRKASRAKVLLKNKTVMTLGPHSRVEIENYLKKKSNVNQLKLVYGKVRAIFKDKKEIPKTLPKKGQKNKTSLLLMKTPSAVVGVRGTDFYLGYNPALEKTEQATLEGKVVVTDNVTGQEVEVPAGKQVDIPKNTGSNFNLATKPIAPEIKEVIRQTSAIVKNDKEFASKEAIDLLGEPEKWSLPEDELPMDLKDIKEEF